MIWKDQFHFELAFPNFVPRVSNEPNQYFMIRFIKLIFEKKKFLKQCS